MRMSPETEKKLTLNDPVNAAELQRLAELQGRRFEIGDALLDLEQEKVRLLVQARQLDDQKSQLFQKIVTDRGLPAGLPVEVDAKTGLVKALVKQPQEEAPAAKQTPA